MASFRKRFEERFGPLDPYDPIKQQDGGMFGTAKPRRSALPTSPEEAMADGPVYTPDFNASTPAPGESGFLENVGRYFGAGTVAVGEMGLGAAEYVARQNTLLDGIVADTIYSGRRGLAETREGILSQISAEDRQKAAAELLTLDPNRTIWQGNPLDVAEAVIYKTAEALPATLVTMIPAIRWARAASPGKAIASMGATEGTMSLGGIQNGIADEILAVPSEQLLQESPRFAELLEQYGGDADEAKQVLIKEAQGLAPLVGGATVAAISAVAGRYFTPIFEKGGGAALGSRAARGFAAESPQEASQGASEQLVQNYAAKIYDADRQLSEGVAEAAAQEGLIGGTMGAGAGAMFGERPPAPPRPPGPTTPPTGLTEQMDFGGDLAPGGFDPNAPADGPRLDAEGNPIMPDAADLPTPEPEGDIDAQILDLLDKESERRGVYIAPGTDERYVATLAENLPKGLTFIRDVDGQGGHLITDNEELGLWAQENIQSGRGSRQQIIGRITGAGVGKPTSPTSRVVQLLDENGAVVRESMQPNQQAAEQLGVKWTKEKGNKGLRAVVLTPEDAIGRREALSTEEQSVGGGEFGIQRDMFGDPSIGDQPPATTPQGPQQLDLPGIPRVRERARGRGPVDVETPVPSQQPDEGAGYPQSRLPQREEEEAVDQAEVDRRQFGMDFREPVTETTTTRTTRNVPTPDVAVQVISDEGEVLEEHRFGTRAYADEAADDLAEQYPDFTVRVVPATRQETQTKTRAKVTPRGPIEPEYQGTVEEEVADDIRANVPFEERDEPLSEVRGSRSVGQASDRLVSRAADEFDKEQKARIGGFYNPDRLTFVPKKAKPKKNGEPDVSRQRALDAEAAEYEAAYRDAWNELRDMEIRREMGGEYTTQDAARRSALLKELAEVRGVAKPKLDKGKSEKFFSAARAVNPASVEEYQRQNLPQREDDGAPRQYGTAVQQRNVEEDDLGEFSVTSRKEADNLANYEVRHKTPAAKEFTVEKFDNNDAAEARVAEIKERYPTRKVFKRMLGSRELDVAFEQAVRFREGREADTRVEEEPGAVKKDESEPEELTGELKFTKEQRTNEDDTLGEDVAYEASINRERYQTPGQKLKFVRREAETLRRRESGQRSIKATPVRMKLTKKALKRKPGEAEQDYQKRVARSEKGKKFDTAPLTQENYPLDESVSSRAKREAEAAKARADLGRAATKAANWAAQTRMASEKPYFFDTLPDQFKTDFLWSMNYLQELIKFARSIQKTKSKSNEATALARGVKEMLDRVQTYKDFEDFTMEWGAIARANEFDDLANLKSPGLASMRDPKKRAKATRATYNKVKGIREMREMNETLRNDPLYQKMIYPVISKMTSYFQRASGTPGPLLEPNPQVVPPYIPNEMELAEIRHAMMTYKHSLDPTRTPEKGKAVNKASGQESFVFPFDDIEYNPNMDRRAIFDALQQRMVDVGFEFDGWGNVVGFQATDRYLEPHSKAKYGVGKSTGATEAELSAYTRSVKPAESAPSPEAVTDYLLRPQRVEQEQTVEEALAAVEKRKEDMKRERKPKPEFPDRMPGLMTIDAVNGLIERFQSQTSTAKTTISGIKRQEQRFIRGLKKLGVWRQTGPSTGVIDIPAAKSKTYRLVGPRLDSKAIKKDAARSYIQKMAKLPIPAKILPEVRAARKNAEAVAGVERFLDENAIELFNEAAGPVKYDAEYLEVVQNINDRMVGGLIRGTDVVNTILENAPQDSFYRNLAVKLSGKDLSDVKVVFGTEADFPSGQPGKYNRKSNTVFINRDVLNMGDEVSGARVVHTLTHELIHAQTHKAIDENPRLKQYFETLQRRARMVWQDTIGGQLPYGLKILTKTDNQAHEFVAEAFSNHEFQNFLKDVPVEPEGTFSLWKALVRIVRYTLNLPETAPNNLFDAIMLTEDILFDDAGFGGTVEGDLYLTGDAVLDNVSTHVNDVWSRSMDWLANKGRNLMTFDQLFDRHSENFGGKNGPFANYMDAFKRRNAAISKNMKVPEKLSTRWTSLEQNDPDAALEVSRLGTEATIDRLTPSVALTTKQREEISETRLKKYDALRARYNAMPQEARNLYDDLRKYYKDALAEETNLMLEASMRGILTKGKGAPMTTGEFRQKFTREVIAELSTKDDIAAALKDIIPEDQLKPIAKQIQQMAHLRTLGVGDYFPLMRYGDYTVYKERQLPDETFDDYGDAMARRKAILEEDPTLDVGVFTEGDKAVVRTYDREFWMFESKTEAQKKANELGPGVEVEARMSRSGEGTAITSNAALTTVLNSLKGNPAAQTAIKEHYLRSLSDQAFRKHELKRKNRKGVNYDIQHRNLATYLKQSAYYRAQLEHGWRMGEAINDMHDYARNTPGTDKISKEQRQRVYDQVKMRDELTNEADELNKWVRKGVNLTQFMMLTSPSYWLINSTQPWLVTAPIMGGKHGIAKSYAAMKNALALVKTPLAKESMDSWFGMKALTKDKVATENAFNVVDQLLVHIEKSGHPLAQEYINLIEELRDINIIDINVLTELRQIADGIDDNVSTRVLDASRILAHITEVNNRVVTAIAAYDLSIQAGESKEDATKYAADMVSQTQFNYSSENKPPLFQSGGPLKWAAPLMFQFMQWPQHMYALLIRNVHAATKGESKEVRRQALKSLTGLLTTHAAVGGLTGMALQPIKWAFGMLMFAFGDDDEPYTFANAINGRTFDHFIQENATELFGQTMGRAVGSGLPTLVGADVSMRMSMGTLYFVDLRGDTAESVLGSLVASFGGATLNQALNWGNALGKVAKGEYYKGAEQAMPKIVKDAMRAGRYYTEGLVNNAGDTVIPAEDMSFGEVFLQGIGFSPDEVSRYYQGQAAIKGAQGYARDRREALVRSFVDEGMSSEILKEVREFNRAYPSMRITRSTLIRGARAQIERERKIERYGANVDEKQARDFARYGEAYR